MRVTTDGFEGGAAARPYAATTERPTTAGPTKSFYPRIQAARLSLPARLALRGQRVRTPPSRAFANCGLLVRPASPRLRGSTIHLDRVAASDQPPQGTHHRPGRHRSTIWRTVSSNRTSQSSAINSVFAPPGRAIHKHDRIAEFIDNVCLLASHRTYGKPGSGLSPLTRVGCSK